MTKVIFASHMISMAAILVVADLDFHHFKEFNTIMFTQHLRICEGFI